MPQLSNEIRSKLIEKILEDNQSGDLFYILKLDMYELLKEKLKTLNDEQLINIITDGEI